MRTLDHGWRLGCVLAWTLAMLAISLASPAGVHGATVSCPPALLLSEEIQRAGSVFVAGVATTAEDPESPGGVLATVVVEEIWRGPELASRITVSSPLYAGTAATELQVGGRYLFLGDPQPVADADDRVARIALPPCSATRPLTPDLAGLRPADAVVMPGFAPEPAAPTSPGSWSWLWLLAGAVTLVAASSFLLRERIGPSARWITVVAGAVGSVTLIAAVVLTLAPDQPPVAVATASPSPMASDLPATLQPAASEPPSAEPVAADPTLVIRIRDSGTMLGSLGQFVSIHADGRVISAQGAGISTPRERRLTSSAVDSIREAIESTGLFGPDAPRSASYEAVLRPGAQPPGRGAYSLSIVVGYADAALSASWTPIFPDEVDLWEPAPEIERLDVLSDLLWNLSDRLPAEAWASDDVDLYQASRFQLVAEELKMVGYAPETSLDEVHWPLAQRLSEAVSGDSPAGPLSRCLTLTRSEAVALVGALAQALGDPALPMGRLVLELAGDSPTVHRLTVEPLLPDESGCGVAATPAGSAVLAEGAIALVRVDGLRMRTGPGPAFPATDALRAGERVAVVRSEMAADGSVWWLVRQGPGPREGWVSAGPTDGDPWLVAIANGAIAFLSGMPPEQILRMDPDGGNIVSLADAGYAAWSPDGTRLVLLVPPTGSTTEWQIALVGPDGAGLSALTAGGSAVWSPDGTRLAFHEWGESTQAISTLRADGTDLQTVANGVAPAWSADGTKLAFWRVDPQFRRPMGDGVVPEPIALWTLDLDTRTETQLTPYAAGDTPTPAWSPDGTMITAGNRLIRTDGSLVQELDPELQFETAPWSPDGEHLIVVGQGKIRVLAVDSGELRDVVSPSAGASHASWSPDGTRIVFSRGLTSPHIAIVEASGGAATDIGPVNSQLPSWQPIVSVPLGD